MQHYLAVQMLVQYVENSLNLLVLRDGFGVITGCVLCNYSDRFIPSSASHEVGTDAEHIDWVYAQILLSPTTPVI